VVLVTSLQVTAPLSALPIYTRLTHHRVTRWEWMWAALLAVALAVFVTVADPEAGRSRGSLQTWLVAAVVLGPVLVSVATWGPRRRQGCHNGGSLRTGRRSHRPICGVADLVTQPGFP
jgi:drug/metabolite transporter (DMT)-like permease